MHRPSRDIRLVYPAFTFETHLSSFQRNPRLAISAPCSSLPSRSSSSSSHSHSPSASASRSARFVCLAIISWLNYCISKKSSLIMSLTRYTKRHQQLLYLTSFGRLCKSMSEPWCSDWDGCGPAAPRAPASSSSCPVLTPTRRWTFERSHLMCRLKR